jgi:hypothetical protein
MRPLLFLGLILLSANLFAFQVEWRCPTQAAATLLDVTIDNNGVVKVNPDIFKTALKADKVDLPACASSFALALEKNAKLAKVKDCPKKDDRFCFLSPEFVSRKVSEKIYNGPSFRGLKLPALPPLLERQFEVEAEIVKRKIEPKSFTEKVPVGKNVRSIAEFDNIVDANIENVLTGVSKDEAKQLVQNYLLERSKDLEGSKRNATLDSVNKMLTVIYGDRAPEELAKIVDCSPNEFISPVADILKKLEKTNSVDKCQELSPGEHKIVPARGFSSEYLVKRRKDGNYQVILNLDFQGEGNGKEMLKRARACIGMATPYMKSKGGPRLEIALLEQEEVDQLPEGERVSPYLIHVQEPNSRSNSNNYASDADCPTITHELLHLVGLCDEYKETIKQDVYSCRVVTKSPSIMRNLELFDKVVPKKNICDCSSPFCKSIMESKDEALKGLFLSQNAYEIMDISFRVKNCTAGLDRFESNAAEIANSKNNIILKNDANEFIVETRSLETRISKYPPFYKMKKNVLTCRCQPGDSACLSYRDEFLNKISKPLQKNSCPGEVKIISAEPVGQERGVSYQNGKLSVVSNPEQGELLLPGHFQKIISGTCVGKTDAYDKCASFAYKSASDPSCVVPKECSDDSYYLGTSK